METKPIETFEDFLAVVANPANHLLPQSKSGNPIAVSLPFPDGQRHLVADTEQSPGIPVVFTRENLFGEDDMVLLTEALLCLLEHNKPFVTEVGGGQNPQTFTWRIMETPPKPTPAP